MNAALWKPEYSINVARLDGHHRELVAMIEDVMEAMHSPDPSAVIESTLTKVLEYASYHFPEEERLMQEFYYPQQQQHASDHDEMRESTKRLIRDIRYSKQMEPLALVGFLAGWLTKHIMKSDKHFGEFLNSRDVF